MLAKLLVATEKYASPESPEFSLAERKSGPSKGSIALDQWRGLALILVLISHGFFFTDRVNGAGRIGVNLFFFISGILSFRSLQHKSDDSPFSLAGSFWWKRLRRLYPALIGYTVTMLVAVVFLQKLPGLPDHSNLSSYVRALPSALTYTMNYYHNQPRVLGHLWSVACEMQFYLLVPLVFLLGGKSLPRRLAVFGLFALSLTAIGFLYPLTMAHFEAVKYHFEVAVWPMTIGFVCEFGKRWVLLLKESIVKVIFSLGVGALAVAMVVMPFGIGGKRLVIALGGVLLLPCLFAYLYGLPFPGRVGRFLAWTGERTYSIYLWQQPLTICDFLPTYLHPFGALASILIGALSFKFLEKPFLSANRTALISANKLTVQ